MAQYSCDICGNELAIVSFNDMVNPENTKFVGGDCLAFMGMTYIVALPADELDSALKLIGYQPTKALRDQRKGEVGPGFDSAATIATVVESAPRIDTGAELMTNVAGEEVSESYGLNRDGSPIQPKGDSETDPQDDLSTMDLPDVGPDEVVVGRSMDGRPITAPRVDDPGDPAPY